MMRHCDPPWLLSVFVSSSLKESPSRRMRDA
jgi:hypothetical protein